MATSPAHLRKMAGFKLNLAPADGARDLPKGLLEFLEPLHRKFTPWQQSLIAKRQQVLAAALSGNLPSHLPPSEPVTSSWQITVPDWCADQRNQMTGPADDGRTLREDAELRCPRRNARSGRFPRQRMVTSRRPASPTSWPACGASSPITTRSAIRTVPFSPARRLS